MITTAWYDLTSRLQSNHVVLQRRQDAPRSWLNKQRQMVNGKLLSSRFKLICVCFDLMHTLLRMGVCVADFIACPFSYSEEIVARGRVAAPRLVLLVRLSALCLRLLFPPSPVRHTPSPSTTTTNTSSF